MQETRGWDDKKEETFSQRAKEDSHDYRYFPDPDLPKLKLSLLDEFKSGHIKSHIPELPWEKRKRLSETFEIKPEDAEVYVRQRNWGEYFEAVAHALGSNKNKIQTASNYITTDLAGLVKGDKVADFYTINLSSKISPENFAQLVSMISNDVVSSRGAKDLLKMMYEEDNDAEMLAEKHGLLQKSDEGTLSIVVQDIINVNPNVVLDYKSGKESALQFLIGQGMKATKGSANPEVLKQVFLKLLS